MLDQLEKVKALLAARPARSEPSVPGYVVGVNRERRDELSPELTRAVARWRALREQQRALKVARDDLSERLLHLRTRRQSLEADRAQLQREPRQLQGEARQAREAREQRIAHEFEDLAQEVAALQELRDRESARAAALTQLTTSCRSWLLARGVPPSVIPEAASAGRREASEVVQVG